MAADVNHTLTTEDPESTESLNISPLDFLSDLVKALRIRAPGCCWLVARHASVIAELSPYPRPLPPAEPGEGERLARKSPL
jgi:hypothetical protein